MFKKIIAGATLATLMLTSFGTASAAIAPEKVMWDVDKTHGLYNSIDKMVKAGIMTLYKDGSYHPQELVTRDQAARYLYNGLLKSGYTNVVNKKSATTMPIVSPFPDVPANDFYAFYIKEMKESGIVNGYENGNYGPKNKLTRGEVLAILEKARAKIDNNFSVSDYKANPAAIKSPHRFTDVDISNTFFNYIYTALDHGYVAKNIEYRTNDFVTKAEMAGLLNRIFYTPAMKGHVDLGTDVVPDSDKTSLFYKGERASLLAEVFPIDANKFALVVDISEITPKIPYINKNIINVTADGENVIVKKITLLKIADDKAIYGIYTDTYDTSKQIEASYGDVFTTLYGTTPVAPIDGEDENPTDDTDNTDNTDNTDDSDDSDDTTTDSDTTSTGDISVTLSDDTPTAGLVPASASGLKVATYDITAEGGDVVINRITIERTGFSDKDTIKSFALFDENGRISRSRDDSQENNTQAILTLIDPIEIKAGDTKSVSVLATLGEADIVSGHKFEIKLVGVETNNTDSQPEVSYSDVKTGTFDVTGMDAPKVTIRKGSKIGDVKLGDKDVELFRFELEGDKTQDIELSQMTFETNIRDAKDDLRNLTIKDGEDVLAKGTMTNGYVTFVFDEKLEIDYSKVKKLTIHGDVIEGAGDQIGFFIDEPLDIQGTYNNIYSIQADITELDDENETNLVTIEAGKLSLVDISPAYDEITEGKRNVVLGELKVGNKSGQSLELQEFGVKIVLNPGEASVNGNADGSLTLKELFENVYLVSEGGSKYELEGPTGSEVEFVYGDDNLARTLNEGDNTFKIMVDTQDDINKFNTAIIRMSMTSGALNTTTGGFYAVETLNNKEVTDITPSSISWNAIEGSESSAKVSLLPLSNITKVRGASNVEALKFELDTSAASAINMNEVTVKIMANGTEATSDEISEVSLYKDSITSKNLLDSVSGSRISTGEVTLSGFENKTALNTKENFIIAISLVDSDTAQANSPLKVTLLDISMEDDELDAVDYVEGDLESSRAITVADAGSLTLTEDSNNDENRYDKLVLAGTTEKVFSIDVQAENENIDIKEITFTLDKDVKDSIKSASIYLDNKLIATNSYSNNTVSGTNTIVAFNNLTRLLIPQQTKTMTLALNTNDIGYEKVGETVVDTKVTMTSIVKAQGKDSRKNLTNMDKTVTTAKQFSIVPATVTPTVIEKLNTSGQAKLRLTVNTGTNTIASSNSKPQIKLNTLTFSELSANSDGYTIYKEGESTRKGVINADGTVDLTNLNSNDLTISGNTTYIIVPNGTTDSTYSLNLIREGVQYDIVNPDGTVIQSGVTSTLEKELDLGIKSY